MIDLKNKTKKEKVEIKSKELAKVKIDKFTKDNLEIEIIGDIKEIDGGIQVFAKAWRNGEQLGFGKDGTVEIERFRFFNPPVLVDDENGDIIREFIDEETKEIKQRKLKEDSEEAIRQILSHTIESVGKDGDNIIEGKIGNTTSTIYPEAGGGGGNTTCDGRAQSPRSNWDTAHDATDADSVQTALSQDVIAMAYHRGSSVYDIYRDYFSFDTSVIGTDTVDSAVYSFYENTSSQAISNADSSSLELVESTQANANDVVVGDYSKTGVTSYSSLALASVNTNQYNAMTLNGAGESFINKTGVTMFAMRNSRDMDDLAPTGRNSVFAFFADETGTTLDPKLVVEHSESVTANSNFLAFMN